jgi:hypothetical protein
VIYNYGTVTPGSTVENTLIITNITDKPYDIVSISGCCGTVVQLETNLLLPGAAGFLFIRLSFGDTIGEEQRVIRIDAENVECTNFMIHVKGVVVNAAQIEPKVANFNAISASKVAERQVILRPAFPFSGGAISFL